MTPLTPTSVGAVVFLGVDNNSDNGIDDDNDGEDKDKDGSGGDGGGVVGALGDSSC